VNLNVKFENSELLQYSLNFQLDEYVNKFETEGPGTEENMDKGQKLMEIYAVEFEKLEATRVEMGK
jgi:hypothetical protein